MDTFKKQAGSKAKIEAGLLLIKDCMPNVYGSIKDKADAVGNEAYALVRKGLRGEPNCFYGFENGHVVGTPFTKTTIMPDIAALMVEYGATHVCILGVRPSLSVAHQELHNAT